MDKKMKYGLLECRDCLRRYICDRTIMSVSREGCSKFEDQQDILMTWDKRKK